MSAAILKAAIAAALGLAAGGCADAARFVDANYVSDGYVPARTVYVPQTRYVYTPARTVYVTAPSRTVYVPARSAPSHTHRRHRR